MIYRYKLNNGQTGTTNSTREKLQEKLLDSFEVIEFEESEVSE